MRRIPPGSHFKMVCERCGTVISQCRCINNKKEVIDGLCENCLREESMEVTPLRRELRDHTEPCEHGYQWEHPVPRGSGVFRRNGFAPDFCPGGKLVVMETLTNECWISDRDGDYVVVTDSPLIEDDEMRATVDCVRVAPVPVWVEVTS